MEPCWLHYGVSATCGTVILRFQGVSYMYKKMICDCGRQCFGERGGEGATEVFAFVVEYSSWCVRPSSLYQTELDSVISICYRCCLTCVIQVLTSETRCSCIS